MHGVVEWFDRAMSVGASKNVSFEEENSFNFKNSLKKVLKIKKILHTTPFTQGFAGNTACPSPPNTSAQVSGAEADARGPDTMDWRAPPTQHSSRWPAPSGWSLPCPCVCLPNPSQAHRRGHPHGLPTSRTRARPPPPPGSERGTTCTCDDYYNHASVRRPRPARTPGFVGIPRAA